MFLRYFLADLFTTASGRLAVRDLRPEPVARRCSFCQLPSLVASREEETTSRGSRTSRIMRLSGSASMRKGAPTPPPGSLTTRKSSGPRLGKAYRAPVSTKCLIELIQAGRVGVPIIKLADAVLAFGLFS